MEGQHVVLTPRRSPQSAFHFHSRPSAVGQDGLPEPLQVADETGPPSVHRMIGIAGGLLGGCRQGATYVLVDNIVQRPATGHLGDELGDGEFAILGRVGLTTCSGL